MNVSAMRRTKKSSQIANLMEGPLNFMCFTGKIFFFTKVGDKQLNDKYSD